MATDKDLLDAFEKLYQYFNRHDFTEQSWATIEPLLADNVTVKKLDGPGYHEGKAALKAYFLYGNGKSDLPSCTIKNRDAQIIGNIGVVSGSADFVDTNTTSPPSNPRPIAYSATFSGATGFWEMIYLWGSCWPS